jgi:hypothetical protein
MAGTRSAYRNAPDGRRGRRVTGRLVGVLMALAGPLGAQELEPRALQNAPIGMNLFGALTGYSRGNLLVDPAVPITDASAEVWSLALAYYRAISLFGQSGKIGLVAPLYTGKWEGTVAGIDTATSRTGLADPRFSLSWNFLGAPALTRSGIRAYRHRTVAGIQLTVQAPLGQYYPDRLINLGLNRWSFQPRLGISRPINSRLTLEAYGAVTFYTANHDYYGGTELSQDPFMEGQLHAIYSFANPGTWVAGSVGYGTGGRITVGDVTQDKLQNARASASFRYPIAMQHALKLVYINGITTRLGADYDTFQLAWQYAYGGKP